MQSVLLLLLLQQQQLLLIPSRSHPFKLQNTALSAAAAAAAGHAGLAVYRGEP